MEYVEFRVRVEDTKHIDAWQQNSPRVVGVVCYGALQRQTIGVLTRWVIEDKISRREELAILGSHLYGVLFAGEVGKEFQEAYRKRGAATLRVVLEFLPAARGLATLPWEYLHVPDDDQGGKGFFIAAEHRLILSRHVPLQVEDETLKPQGNALRVLVVISRPTFERVEDVEDGEKVSVKKPMGIVQSADVIDMLGKLAEASGGRLQLQQLEQPDKKTFAEALAKHQPHMIHFIGHGRYKKDGGALAFVQGTNGDSEALWLSDSDFTDFFRSITPPRLIFLHACEGARSESYEAFSGVALQLVYSRIPAVVAMQYPITNNVAIAFVRSLYGALSRGSAIDEAVQQGRNDLGVNMKDANFSNPAFGSPVVFLQSKDSRSLQGIVLSEPLVAPSAAPASLDRDYKCPNPSGCRNAILPERRFCTRCKFEYKICVACREAIGAAATFCDNCGADVGSAIPAALVVTATSAASAASSAPRTPVAPATLDPSRPRRF